MTPSTMYTVTGWGIYRSTDSGVTWTLWSPGPETLGLVWLVVNPLDSSTLYVAGPNGLFRTTDAGANWTLRSSEPAMGSAFYELYIDPLTPTTLYTFAPAAGAGLIPYRSADGGATWVPAGNGITKTATSAFFGFTIDPQTPSTLYFGHRGKLDKSVDSGATWSLVWDAEADVGIQVGISGLLVNPQSSSVLYLFNTGVILQVWRSTDAGISWTQVLGLPTAHMAIDPQTPSNLYASTLFGGVYRSTDGGSTWAPGSGLITWGGPVAVRPAAPATVYTSTSYGVFRSDDAGANWSPSTSGIRAQLVSSFAVAGQATSTLYAGTTLTGIHKSTDGGNAWTAVNSGLPSVSSRVAALAADPQTSSTLYAGIWGMGMFRTTDSGANWTAINNGISMNATITAIAVDPQTPTTVYAGTAGAGLFRSMDSGDNWSPTGVVGGTVLDLVIDPSSPSTVYAANGTIFRSTDSGANWTPVSAGLGFTVLAIDPSTSSTLYGGTPNGVFRSTNAGSSWHPINTGLTDLNVTSLAVDPQAPSTLYAGTGQDPGNLNSWIGSGVFRSTNAGASWAPLNSGLFNLGVTTIKIAPSSPTTLYVGTGGSSTFRWEPATATFGKIGPAHGAIGQSTSPTLKWSTSPGATSYEYCIDTSNNDTCNGVWASVGTATSASIPGLIAGTTYYWQVRAIDGGVTEADFGSWWRFEVGVTPGANLLLNGDFSNGTTNWLTFATPDPSYLASNLTNGVFQYYRVPPPPGTSNQAVIFQQTGAALDKGAPIVAQFELGNSSTARKRVSVLVIDADFSDLSVCTFWLDPGAALQTYQMKTHTTQAWANAAIYFYAASAGSDGGFSRIDNVSLQYAPAESSSRTDCVDPTAPAPPGGATSGTLLANGDFGAGLAPWMLFGQITQQIAGGVFEFFRPAGTPGGVVFQAAGQPVADDGILTSTFELGNSSGVRKRVTVVLHDGNFADLSACTFWLPPGLALSSYAMRTFATQAWADATLSIYPATVGTDQWILLDNVTLELTPAVSTVGTECIEPTSGLLGPISSSSSALQSSRNLSPPVATMDDGAPEWIGTGGFHLSADADHAGTGLGWRAVGATTVVQALRWARLIDLRDATSASLSFRSLLSAERSTGELQVSIDGAAWTTVATVPASDAWTRINVDLSTFSGRVIAIRFVFDGTAARRNAAIDFWLIDEVSIRKRGP